MKEYFHGDMCYEPAKNGSKFILNFQKSAGGGAK